jgi:hypothetical protein
MYDLTESVVRSMMKVPKDGKSDVPGWIRDHIEKFEKIISQRTRQIGMSRESTALIVILGEEIHALKEKSKRLEAELSIASEAIRSLAKVSKASEGKTKKKPGRPRKAVAAGE